VLTQVLDLEISDTEI
jgi:hypothetical protein